ncbi:MAG TPA: hypothetical protein VJS38_00020 [Phenylobacterium sp.]|uniref:hypothetical protein n=1 Tax=Phenylobacterium sp. TaxID=1871053 RepID=UPI002B463A82|nr:hypothetical protein [Phenylobacterium sp.]HKR86536.1 hypothetical protein [Phenylobacterium sp.]HKT54568.1 hypothetical protein [Caulobacteraceae bacterium]
MLASTDPTDSGGAPQRPAFGRTIWGWGPAGGLILWIAGFLILPWWAALLLWWWPSILFGAALGLATVELAKRLGRLTAAGARLGVPQAVRNPSSEPQSTD